jgi:hypothetical protein
MSRRRVGAAAVVIREVREQGRTVALASLFFYTHAEGAHADATKQHQPNPALYQSSQAPERRLIRAYESGQALEPSLHQLGQAPMVAAANQTVLLLHQLSLAGPRPPYQSEPKSVVG